MRPILVSIALAMSVPSGGFAGPSEVLSEALTGYVQPGFTALADRSADLAQAASMNCAATNSDLQAAFAAAWDDWIEVSHLRFGPTETDNRAFALGFWPDTRSKVPKTLGRLVADEDPAVFDPIAFAQVSVAARGFTAMEFLLFDPSFTGDSDYLCALRQAVAADIAVTTAEIAADWTGSYGAAFLSFGEDAPFRGETEAMGALYGAILTGLQFTRDARLGRPMGTFERPRPNRAEARRSGRSVRHIRISVASTGALAAILGREDAVVVSDMEDAFARALRDIDRIADPSLADVADPIGRIRAEAASQAIEAAALSVRNGVGVLYGLAEGFNALDGD